MPTSKKLFQIESKVDGLLDNLLFSAVFQLCHEQRELISQEEIIAIDLAIHSYTKGDFSFPNGKTASKNWKILSPYTRRKIDNLRRAFIEFKHEDIDLLRIFGAPSL